jgi:uncharacterized membrane protein
VDTALVWIVLIVTSGVVGVTSIRHRSKGVGSVPPEEVLKLRFANGQIGEDEYVRRLAVLQHDRLLELGD